MNYPIAKPTKSQKTGRPAKPRIDNAWEVSTPENISFEYRLAGPFQRIGAFLLDVLITQVCYWVVVSVILMFLGFFVGTGLGSGFELFAGAILFAILAGSFAMNWFYGAFAETYFNGQTIGKSVLKLRVLSSDGSAIDGSQAILRNFFRLIDCMPLASPMLLFGVRDAEFQFWPMPTFVGGLLIMLVNRRFQRVGDLVAGTVVINESGNRNLHMIKIVNHTVVQHLAGQIPTDFVISRSLSKALATYVGRRQRFSRERLREIASRLAPLLIAKLNLPPNTDYDLLLCALYYRGYFSELQDQKTGNTSPAIRGNANSP